MTGYAKNVAMSEEHQAKMISDKKEILLSIQDLKVWFELRRFGFGHAGFVKAVDGISFDLNHGLFWDSIHPEPVRLYLMARNSANLKMMICVSIILALVMFNRIPLEHCLLL
jgi:hypothetical protein